jgi:hypothetical protein
MTDYEYMSRDTLVAELTKAQIQIGELENQVQIREALAKSISDNCDGLKAKLSAVEAWIDERVENDEVTDEVKELAEAVDYELVEEVEVTLTMSMVVTIKKPVGADIDDTDFWTFSNDWIESTYEIVSTEDLSVDCAE